MRSLVALMVLVVAPGAHALVLEDAGSTTLTAEPGAKVTRTVLVDAWDAGEPAHEVHLRWLADALPEVEAKFRPARGTGPWTPVPPAGLAWGVGSDFRATQHGWDGQMLLELRFRMPTDVQDAELMLRSDGDLDALRLATRLAPIPSPTSAAPGLAWVRPGQATDVLWNDGAAPPSEPPLPAPPAPGPGHAVPGPPLGLPISLFLAAWAGRSLVRRRQP